MVSPVASIEKWIAEIRTDPVTKTTHEQVVPNCGILNAINKWKLENIIPAYLQKSAIQI